MRETTVVSQPSGPVLNVLGLMSGTSVDSIDAACIRVAMCAEPLALSQFEILGTHTLEIDPALRERLLKVMADNLASLEELCRLNVDVGEVFSSAAQVLIDQLKQQNIRVDLVASHGQTLYHIPPFAQRQGSTMQIGDAAVIAERTGLSVAADFRPGDMAAGGHGAPLVPFADRLLFSDKQIARAVQNIGGIANVTAITALENSKQNMMAFDTGPGNMIIDALCQQGFQQPYDANGEIAARGQVHQGMLKALMAHPYLSLPPPKTTGRELFGENFTQSVVQQWESQVSWEDMIATVTLFTAQSIAEAYKRFVLPRIAVTQMVVGGGGVFNNTLITHLQDQLRPLGVEVKRHEDFGIDSKYKEAIAFALLGYARFIGLPNNIPACTGASHSVVLGGLWRA